MPKSVVASAPVNGKRTPTGRCFRLGSIAVHEPGEAYEVGSKLVVTEDDPITMARVVVDSIDEDGGIITAHIEYAGCYRTEPPFTCSTAPYGESPGNDATLDCTWTGHTH